MALQDPHLPNGTSAALSVVRRRSHTALQDSNRRSGVVPVSGSVPSVGMGWVIPTIGMAIPTIGMSIPMLGRDCRPIAPGPQAPPLLLPVRSRPRSSDSQNPDRAVGRSGVFTAVRVVPQGPAVRVGCQRSLPRSEARSVGRSRGFHGGTGSAPGLGGESGVSALSASVGGSVGRSGEGRPTDRASSCGFDRQQEWGCLRPWVHVIAN